MKIFPIQELAYGKRHILSGLIPGEYISQAGLGFKKPDQRSHDTGCDCNACDGKGKHIHENDHEVFIILHGKAKMEVDGKTHALCAGDVVICEPGEDHHLISDHDDPCVNVFLHASDLPNIKQRIT
jgi:mannose-6-phosphate isomerase-like protein (cupin superfamily)